MARKNIWTEVDTLSYSSFDYATVADMAATLKDLNERYPGARIDKMSEQYSDEYYLSIRVEVPETDAQMEAREAQEARYAAQREAQDLAAYLELQKKFGDKFK